MGRDQTAGTIDIRGPRDRFWRGNGKFLKEDNRELLRLVILQRTKRLQTGGTELKEQAEKPAVVWLVILAGPRPYG